MLVIGDTIPRMVTLWYKDADGKTSHWGPQLAEKYDGYTRDESGSNGNPGNTSENHGGDGNDGSNNDNGRGSDVDDCGKEGANDEGY